MKKIIYLTAISLVFLSAAGNVLATTINTSIPGATTASSPGEFINAFYVYALWLGGILAFGAVVFGGVKYILAAGNPSGQNEGKDWIKSALLGLLLLGGAYLILNVINPNLVNLSLPDLNTASSNAVNAPMTVGSACTNNPGGCPTGTTCYQGYCTTLCGGTSNGVCLSAGQTCVSDTNGNRSCQTTISQTAACSNQNHTGTCVDPSASCQNINDNWTCVIQQNTANDQKQCTFYGITAGGCIYLFQSGVSGCNGVGTTETSQTCTPTSVVTTHTQCFKVIKC